MRFQRLGLSLSAALTLAFAPAGARAQVIVRERCFDRWDYCARRDEIDRRASDRALERAVQAEARERRLADARREREFSSRIQAGAREDARADARAAAARQSELRARERDRAIERRDRAALDRSLRIRPTRFRFE